eukprot:m.195666 g.195666  ORF g.195666 m.195666 type:complete len:76 (-) comp17005_c0_seq3:1774-2001(-)
MTCMVVITTPYPSKSAGNRDAWVKRRIYPHMHMHRKQDWSLVSLYRAVPIPGQLLLRCADTAVAPSAWQGPLWVQ